MAGDRISPSLAGLVERDDLIAEIVEQQARVVTRGGCLVWLLGEAGVGKTSLVRALAARTANRVLIGNCDALSTPRPLGPLLDMAATGADRIAAAIEAGAARHDLFESLLAELSTPTLAIIEDVHWADEGTVDLLRFLGRRITRTRSVVLVTLRSDEVDSHPLLRVAIGDLASAPGCRRLTVDALSLGGVRQMTEGHALDALRLHAVTGGNPFYVTEALSTESWSVPATVADAVLARASRLPGAAGVAIDVVSIEAAGMEWWLAERLGSTPDGIQQAIDAGMLTVDRETLRFRHEIARMAISARLRTDRRVALHRDALAALGQRTGTVDPARLANHSEQAGDPGAVVRWAPTAAERADRAGAHRESVAQYRRALRAADEADVGIAERCSLVAALAVQLTMVDRQVEALDARQQVLTLRRQLGDPAAAAEAMAHLARAMWRTGRGEDAYRTITIATEEIERLEPHHDDASQRAAVLTTRAYLDMLGRRDSAPAFADRAIAAASSCGDWHSLAQALNAKGAARIVLADDLGGVDDLERSRSIGVENRSDHDVSDALRSLGSGLGEVRRMELAARYLEDAVAHATNYDNDTNRRYCQAWLARVRFEQGRWAETDDLLTPDLHENVIASIVALTVDGRLRSRRGAPGAFDVLARAWSLAAETQDIQRLWPVVCGRCEMAWLADAVDDTLLDDLRRVAGVASGKGMRFAIGELGWWQWKLGIRSGALPDQAAAGYALHVAGEVQASAEWWDALGAPYDAALALADADDEQLLRKALGRFIALGATALARRIRRRLRELGARDIPRGPQSSTASSPNGLTRREVDVLALLADGLTNREIASRLHLSVRTVGHHVGAILRKLDVRTRTEAAVAFAAHGHNN